MTSPMRIFSVFFGMAILLAIVGFYQSWNVAFSILNLCVISSIMALGVNVQWGYAGLVNFGVMGFVAVGGLAGVIVSMPPVEAAWAAGGTQLMGGFAIMGLVILVATIFWKKTAHLKHHPRRRYLGMAVIIILGYAIYRFVADPAIEAIEAVEPAKTGYLGGLGLHILFSWIVGAIAAGLIAMLIGRIALGLRSDYWTLVFRSRGWELG